MIFPLQRLAPGDALLFDRMLDLFGRAFEDPDSYGSARPSPAYRDSLLADPTFTALVAMDGDVPVGALAAYEMRKFEQERSEIYIYDLAVEASHRRRGIATALIREVTRIAQQRGAHVVMVQADYEDPPAIALYTKLGRREEVLHFDIEPLSDDG